MSIRGLGCDRGVRVGLLCGFFRGARIVFCGMRAGILGGRGCGLVGRGFGLGLRLFASFIAVVSLLSTHVFD